MTLRRAFLGFLAVLFFHGFFTLAGGAGGDTTLTRASGPETVIVKSGSLALRALVWRPEGKGPFPAVLFNHGSWPSVETPLGRGPDPRILEQAAALGPVFARHGYLFVYLFRRGVGLSTDQGINGADILSQELAANGQEARNRAQLRLLRNDELGDARAALEVLRELPEVDRRRIAVAGHSFGGSLLLFLGQLEPGLGAAVDFAGAAGSWSGSPGLRAQLLDAAGKVRFPVLFLHAENDFSTEPGTVLAAEMARLGRRHRLRIYPASGATPADGHSFVHLNVALWERDVFAFLKESLRY